MKKEIIDAHGNKTTVEVADDHGSGPAHLKSKHPKGRFTGRIDAHGNEIWETPKRGGEAAE